MVQKINHLQGAFCLLFLWQLIGIPIAHGADIVFEISDKQEIFVLNKYLQIWEESEGNWMLGQLLHADSLFEAFDPNKPLKRQSTYWGKLHLKNTMPYAVKYVLSPDWGKGSRSNEFIEVYSVSDSSVQKTGRYWPAYKKDSLIRKGPNNQVLISLEAQQEETYYIKIWQIDNKRPVFEVRLIDYSHWRSLNQENRNVIQGVFQGVIWIMMLYSLMTFWGTGDKSYLFYALYLFATSIYSLYLSGVFTEVFLKNIPTTSLYISIVFSNLLGLSYFQFGRSFMNTRVLIPFWDRAARGLMIGMVGMTFIELSVCYFTFNSEIINLLIKTTILFEVAFLMVIFLRYLRTPNVLARIFILGSLCIVLAGLFGIYADTTGVLEKYFYVIELFFIAEILTFSLGLAYRIQMTEKEKSRERAEAEKLKELHQVKSRFFANISHEFRTPLTIISGTVRELKSDWRDSLEPKVDEQLEAIHRNGSALLKLVNEILELSRLESQAFKLNMQQADILVFLTYLFEPFHIYAQKQGLQFEVESEIDTLWMDFDSHSIQRIMSNLLSNALKFTPEKGTVSVLLRKIQIKNQAHLEVMVRDTGKGIAPAHLPYIFDRFYQAEVKSVGPTIGSGIGLSLVKEQLNLLGGDIQVASELGKGSNFNFRLPIYQNAPKAHADLEKPLLEGVAEILAQVKTEPSSKTYPSASGFEKNLVLLIEDNPDIVNYLKSCLDKDYRLAVARNGAEGIDLALQIIPDLIISDVMMPLKDGYEVCKTLKHDTRSSHIPIILLTARADQQDKLIGLAHGADAYLIKPFNKEELLLRIMRLIELRTQLRAKFSGLGLGDSKAGNLSKEDAFIRKARELIDENLTNEAFGIDTLCLTMGMSYTQLHRKLKALSGMSASLFIRDTRLQKAHYLLQTSRLNVSEVAYEVGFSDPAYFSRAFSQKFGVPPSTTRLEQI